MPLSSWNKNDLEFSVSPLQLDKPAGTLSLSLTVSLGNTRTCELGPLVGVIVISVITAGEITVPAHGYRD